MTITCYKHEVLCWCVLKLWRSLLKAVRVLERRRLHSQKRKFPLVPLPNAYPRIVS